MREVARQRGRWGLFQYLIGIVVPLIVLWGVSVLPFFRAGHRLEIGLALSVAFASFFAGTLPALLTALVAALLYAKLQVTHMRSWDEVFRDALFFCVLASGGYVISALRRWRKALLARNEQLQIMLDWVRIGIVHFGLDRTVQYSNAAFWRMYGFERGEYLGKSLPLPEDRKAEWKVLEEQLRRGEPFLNVKTKRMRKDGSMFTAYISGVPLFDENHELAGLMGLIIESDELPAPKVDIEDLLALADTSSEFLMLLDTDLRVVYANSGLATIAGKDLNAIQGTHILEFFAPDQQAKAEAYFLELLESNAYTEHYPELRMKNLATGSDIPVQFKIFPIYRSSARTLVSIACVGKDLEHETALLERLSLSERDKAALFDSMPISLVMANAQGVTIACNKKFEEMTGYTAEEAKRMSFASLVYPDDFAAGHEQYLKLISGKIDRYVMPKRLVHKQGNVFKTKMTVNLIRDAAGKPDHTISMIEPLFD